MVPDIKKILFTTDLSKESRQAFDYAVSLADRYGASITILHVIEEVTAPASTYLQDFLGDERWQQIKDSHEQEARQILIGKRREGAMIREALGEFAEQAKAELGQAGVVMDEVVVAHGHVVEEVLLEAQRRSCDLIVMGYHARGRLEEAVVGSTTRRVLRRSSIPVLLVRLPE
jgi:nucleotide-binding universal stress UspA family protein